MEKECVINPKTGRAVVVKGKIGRQVLKNQAAQPVKAKTAPKPKPKEPNTMYKKPIGPKVEDIPRILKNKDSNKKLDVDYKTITTKNKDGGITMKRVVDNKKSKIVDNMFWRKKLETKEEINKMNPKTLIMNMMDYLGNIDSYLKLNVKLDRDDEANFNALYPTIELFLDQIDKLNVDAKDILTNEGYKTYEKYYNKYIKLRKIIKGQKENIYEERPTEYNKANIYPKKSLKPDYTKDGYFQNKHDFYNFLKSLVNLKPELKDLYRKHRLDITTFVEKLNKMDKRIPPKPSLIEKLDRNWDDEFVKIFIQPRRR